MDRPAPDEPYGDLLETGDVAGIAALANATTAAAYRVVAERGRVGRDAVAADLGVARSVAAFHLDKLVAGGLLLLVAGLAVWGLGRLGFRGLPGDIAYRGENVQVYFPIVTCLVISILLSAIFWLVRLVQR